MSIGPQAPGTRPARRKTLLLAVVSTLLGLVFALLAAEGALRLLPVNELLGSLPVNDANPMLRYLPNRDLTWSKFADFSMANRVHVNNYGFLNDQDYDPAATSPLLAVVGDSFIEAAMVPYAETLQGRLAARLAGRMRVYSFARSGAPLSQYLACAAWAENIFHPDYLVFNIVSNDFDESLLRNAQYPGFHFFQRQGGGWTMRRIDYSPGLGSLLVRRSRLLAYLLTNATVQRLPQRVLQAVRSTVNSPGDSASAGDRNLEDSREAVAAFFELLPSRVHLPPDRICFILDANRPAVYQDAPAQSTYATVRTEFLKTARAKGYRVLDLDPVFSRDYRAHHQHFEFAMDGHWTPYAHGVVTSALLDSGFPPTPAEAP